MFRLQVQPDSEIPISQQLLAQLQLAIASGHYTSGQRLPSTRQLAQQLNIHYNTVSRVYRLLAAQGLVDLKKGSGIYVKSPESPVNYLNQTISHTIDTLLNQGFDLKQIQEIFTTEINSRLLALEKVIVTVPQTDLDTGELISQELTAVLNRDIPLIPLEELKDYLRINTRNILITHLFFASKVSEIINNSSSKLLIIKIYDYQQEIAIIKELPPGTYLGLVSLSRQNLTLAQTIMKAIRGEEIIIMTAQAQDTEKLQRIVKFSNLIISDRPSKKYLEAVVATNKSLKFLRIIWIENYISKHSLEMIQNYLRSTNSNLD